MSENTRNIQKVVIIGSGPAGYTAAIYAARARLEPVMFEGFHSGPAGGQLMTTTDVENFPGFPAGITGPELMECFKKQAERFGTRCLMQDVASVDFTKTPFEVNGTKDRFLTHSVIICTGAMAKRLDIPGTRDGEFWQKGVSACAVCDGAIPIFRNKELYVIGGGDAACEEAMFLTKYASKVYLVHRRDELRASKIMAERAIKHPGLEIVWDSVIEQVSGSSVVESVIIRNLKTGEQRTRPAGGLFFAVGHVPNTVFLSQQLQLNDVGYIIVKPGTTQTSVEGVFAGGDVQDFVYRQAVTAAGTGCMAALEAERYLVTKEIH
ncbi:MAG TPA: thioredoxin-disulfide reductase [Anaerolineales bacterium]|nr:thioredoxin-disulfide reductase [Anaerolineales bacterium]